MDYRDQIAAFLPACPQEEADRALLLDMIASHGDILLTRDCPYAHLTSSGFILNRTLDKALLAHHNIYDCWAWTGGHADGDRDLLQTALREGLEETGLEGLVPLSKEILSLDVLHVLGHRKNGAYVSAHLHLSAAYVLIGDEKAPVRRREGENSGVRWFPVGDLEAVCGTKEPEILWVYNKLIARARGLVSVNCQ